VASGASFGRKTLLLAACSAAEEKSHPRHACTGISHLTHKPAASAGNFQNTKTGNLAEIFTN